LSITRVGKKQSSLCSLSPPTPTPLPFRVLLCPARGRDNGDDLRSEDLRDGFPHTQAAGGFHLGSLLEEAVDLGVDDPPWRVAGAPSLRSAGVTADPSEGVELLEHPICVPPRQPPHGPVAPLDVTVGDPLEAVGEDVPGDGREALVVVGQPEDAGLELDGVGQQELVQELRHAPRRVGRDDGRQLLPRVLDAVEDDAEPSEYRAVLLHVRS